MKNRPLSAAATALLICQIYRFTRGGPLRLPRVKEPLVDSAALSLRQAEGMRGRSGEQDRQVLFLFLETAAPVMSVPTGV